MSARSVFEGLYSAIVRFASSTNWEMKFEQQQNGQRRALVRATEFIRNADVIPRSIVYLDKIKRKHPVDRSRLSPEQNRWKNSYEMRKMA